MDGWEVLLSIYGIHLPTAITSAYDSTKGTMLYDVLKEEKLKLLRNDESFKISDRSIKMPTLGVGYNRYILSFYSIKRVVRVFTILLNKTIFYT